MDIENISEGNMCQEGFEEQGLKESFKTPIITQVVEENLKI